MSNNFIQKEVEFKGDYSKTVFNTLHMSYRPFILKIITLLILGGIGRIFVLANTNIIGIWVDSLCKTGDHCKPIPQFFMGYTGGDYIALISLLIAVGFVMTLAFRVGFSRVSAQAVSRLYDEVTLRTSRYPLSFFDTTPAGRIITRFSSDYGNVFRLFGGPLAEFISIIFDIVVMTLLIGIASPFYLPLVGLIAVAYFLIYKLNQNKLRQARRELSASRAPSIAHFSETVQGATTIRTFSREGVFNQRFMNLDEDFQKNRLSTIRKLSFFALQMNSLSALMLLGTGALAMLLLHLGHVTIGSIGVAFSFIVLSSNTVMMFFEWLAQFEEAMIGVERLDHYLRRQIEPQSKIPAHSDFATDHPRYQKTEEVHPPLTTANNAQLEVRNLSLRYEDKQPLVLNNISFTVQAGERLGIIGRTGSGKSSIIQSIFYLYPFASGIVAIDGKSPLGTEDTTQVDINQFRRAIALIAQEPVLFRGTLRENLIEGKSTANDGQLVQILNEIGLGEWYRSQKDGLACLIDEKGKNLSSGERQLLCMARCILQNAPIVIMDEATSSIDPQSEEILGQATERFFKGKTQIIIAHRLSTLENCDRILWLDKGEIKMLGKPGDVLAKFRYTANQAETIKGTQL